MATRFELRSPCPKSNSYLVFATAYLAMLDGILAVLEAEKEPKELEASISKQPGEEDFYLETDRAYRAEVDVFDSYTEEERDAMFGKAPGTVYETLSQAVAKFGCLGRCKAFTVAVLDSYRAAMLNQWVMELHNRIVPQTMDLIRKCAPLHNPADAYDAREWAKIDALRCSLGKTTLVRKSLLARIVEALDRRDYEEASNLQKMAQNYKTELEEAYAAYEKNLL
jgi:glutamine synthetase